MLFIDYRERALFEECQKILPDYANVKIESMNLKLGDMMSGQSIMERKTWADLEASMKDKRYTEQSFRLQEAIKEGYKFYSYGDAMLIL